MSEQDILRVDRRALWEALDTARQGRQLTWRDIANQVGTSPSTFSRLKQGLGTDADTFVSLIVWLQARAEDFVEGGGAAVKSGQRGMRLTQTALSSMPPLNDSERRLLDRMVAGALRGIQEQGRAGRTDRKRPRRTTKRGA